MPSTYTVNLGIEKIATGEQSGTWGDTTNTNLDLIDEAVNGVVVITLASAGTSGSPNTLAITNGTSSNGRNKYIEFTDGGDLGATAYVQLTPNDAEKVVHIRNNLSGSQSLIIFQGTYNASNDYEIPAGKDVVLKFDGGGTGAVVSQVFEDLYVEGLTVDGSAVFNEAGADVDFRVESDTDANALFVEGSSGNIGIGTTTPNTVGFNSEYKVVTVEGGTTGGVIELSNSSDEVSALWSNSGQVTIDADTSDVASDSYIRFRVDDSEAMRIDSSGFVGIGTSSPNAQLEIESADSSSNASLSIRGGSASAQSILFLGDNTNINVQHIISDHGDNSLRFNTAAASLGGGERMRITSGGNVGIGTSSPLGKLHVAAGTPSAGGTVNSVADQFVITGSDGANNGMTILGASNRTGNIFFADPDSDFSGYVQYDHASDYMRFGTSATEQMRIDSSGRVMVSTTTQLTRSSNLLVYRDGSSTDPLSVYFPTSGTTSRTFNVYSNVGGTATNVMNIRSDGDCQNVNNSYGAISDERLKQDVIDANSQWDDIKSLQFKNYRLKDRVAQSEDDAPTHLGLIAQDLEASGMSGLVSENETLYWEEGDELPEGVSVGDVKDQGYKTVKYSILYLKAVKALQEAMERIETLESTQADLITRIEALEGN